MLKFTLPFPFLSYILSNYICEKAKVRQQGKVMSESINVENKKQNHLKPPRSAIRIAGEILAGAVAGFAVAVPAAYVIGADVDKGCFAGFEALAKMILVLPPVYGLGSAVGVYLLGNIGKQTGSFLLTLGCGLLGGLVMLAMLLVLSVLSGVLIVGVERILLWTLGVLILLIPPIMATIGFNLRRRYKQPPSS
jgi:hypothetical protein